MPTRKQLFEDMGLLQEVEPLNPYQVLGVNPEFASSLLEEDRSGEALRNIANGMYRALSKRYHPDVATSGNDVRFREITDANDRIVAASPASLARWAKATREDSSIQIEKVQARLEETTQRAADMLQATMENSGHPHHFSQLPLTQGILLERSRRTLLMRNLDGRGIGVTQGVGLEAVGVEEKDTKLKAEKVPKRDFITFMREHESFGIDPHTTMALYLDETGRASILNSNLTFLMDITGPVTDFRNQRLNLSAKDLEKIGDSDAWLRMPSPLLCITSVPETTDDTPINTKMVVFHDRQGELANAANTAWDIDMEVVGSLSESDYFKRIRYAKQVGVTALNSSEYSRTRSFFNLLAFAPARLIEDNPGYTPLISSGNALLLYDETRQLPVVTDTKVIGLIGSNASAK